MADQDTTAGGQTNISRRVANLSSSQIENKRAIDRANQRFFRAKRKSEVDQLQNQVESLTLELQETRRELSGYQERERILRDAFYAAFRISGIAESVSSRIEAPFAPSSASHSVTHEAGLFDEDAHRKDSIHSFMGNDFNTYQHAFPIDFGPGINVEIGDSTQALDYSMMNIEEGGLGHVQPSTGTSPTSGASGYHVQSQNGLEVSAELEDVPDWQGLPLNLPPSVQLDHVILDTTKAFRDTNKTGQHHDEMNAARFPSISSLLNRQAKEVKKLYPVSNAAAAQVWRSPIDSFPCRVGFMYMLSHLLRWYICRTQESYEKLPVCIRPTRLQRTIPHPAWIDVIVWPQARDAIIQHMDWSRFEEYRMITAKTLSVGWPQTDSRSFLDSDDGKHFTLKPEFEEHLRDDKNWSIGIETASLFPFMRPFCRDPE